MFRNVYLVTEAFCNCLIHEVTKCPGCEILRLRNDCNLVTKRLAYEIGVTNGLIAKHLKIQKF